MPGLEKIVITDKEFLDESIFSREETGQIKVLREAGLDEEKDQRIIDVFRSEIQKGRYGVVFGAKKHRHTSEWHVAKFFADKGLWSHRRTLYETAVLRKKQEELEEAITLNSITHEDINSYVPREETFRAFKEYASIFGFENVLSLSDAAILEPTEFNYLESTVIKERFKTGEEGEKINISIRGTNDANMYKWLQVWTNEREMKKKQDWLKRLVKSDKIERELQRYSVVFELSEEYQANSGLPKRGEEKAKTKVTKRSDAEIRRAKLESTFGLGIGRRRSNLDYAPRTSRKKTVSNSEYS